MHAPGAREGLATITSTQGLPHNGFKLRRLLPAAEGRERHRAAQKLINPDGLDGVADADPRAPRARHGAAHEHQVAVRVDRVDHQVLRRPPPAAHAARHLLAAHDAARVLAAAHGAVRAVRLADAVRRALAAEVPALHGALEALALGHALDVDLLPLDEVVRPDREAPLQHRVGRDAELGQEARHRPVLAEVAPRRGRGPHGPLQARAELQRGVPLLGLRLDLDDAAVVHVQRGQRVAPPGIVPGADHADLDGERARPPRHLRAARGRAAVALGVAHEAAR